MRNRFVAIALLIILCVSALGAEKKDLSLEAIFHPEEKVDFDGAPQSGFLWLDENRFLWPKTDADGSLVEVVAVDAKGGRASRLFDVESLVEKLSGIEGVTEETADTIAHRSVHGALTKDGRRAMLDIEGDLYLFTLHSGELRRLTNAEGEEEVADLSPDARSVVFVRDQDLWMVDVESLEETRLTTGGGGEILNGKLDWVYQEEIYGRGDFRGFWWSPDSRSIAFLRLDESPVGEFLVVDNIPYRQSVEKMRYPKAGDPNPHVTLHVVDVDSGVTNSLDTSRWDPNDMLVVDVAWTPDSRNVVFQVQNREQTWLDLSFGNRETGEVSIKFRETTPAWVEAPGSPEWLSDGTFLWLSERDGWKHIYHYREDGGLIRQVTDGEWEVRTLHGADSKKNWIFFSGTERSSRDLDLYRIRLDGSGMARLSTEAGRHRAIFDPTFRRYIDTWSSATAHQQVNLHQADGKLVRSVYRNTIPPLAEYVIPEREFLQIETRDGFVMEAVLIKPTNFDPTKKYPVFEHIYGGPHAPQVSNSESSMFHNFLAQNGIIVWILDNRTASGKGAVSTWPVHHNFGELELRDVEDGVTWLKEQPWVDGDRIMISGWSYGGFMAAYALTHSTSFAGGISGAPVIDWRDYDTIYTERYMGLPSKNQEGYEKSSPRFAAENLHGELLLIHGTIDENVHVQNSYQFADALQKAGKEFRMMVYPGNRHGIRNELQRYHLYRTMWTFIRDVIGEPKQTDRAESASSDLPHTNASLRSQSW